MRFFIAESAAETNFILNFTFGLTDIIERNVKYVTFQGFMPRKCDFLDYLVDYYHFYNGQNWKTAPRLQ